MKDSVALSLVLPCYNEEEIFEESVVKITQTHDESGFSYEVVFVEDKSCDNTAKFVQDAIKKNKKFHAIFHRINQGRGASVSDGIHAAKGKIVGFIDIDCEVSPVYIPEMVALIASDKADMVLGNRIYRTGLSRLHREILSAGYRWLSDTMIGTGKMDTESGYKFFDRKKILPVLDTCKHTGWFWDTEIVVRAKKAGLRVVAHPVLFLRRTDKTSTVRILRDTMDYLVALWKFRKELVS